MGEVHVRAVGAHPVARLGLASSAAATSLATAALALAALSAALVSAPLPHRLHHVHHVPRCRLAAALSAAGLAAATPRIAAPAAASGASVPAAAAPFAAGIPLAATLAETLGFLRDVEGTVVRERHELHEGGLVVPVGVEVGGAALKDEGVPALLVTRASLLPLLGLHHQAILVGAAVACHGAGAAAVAATVHGRAGVGS
mmetsp:Transcript_84398/g.272806  ORF Transcript_84398/g.272806 Transcript_84398/m.272806 type:complete len:200 (-) Transcript_84398:53-652(-)